MDTNTMLRLLSKMDCQYEIHSDTPGITFDNGFKSYNKLPTPSEMLRILDNRNYADRHECRSVGRNTIDIMDNMETKLRVCPFCGSKVEFVDEADDCYFGYSKLDEWVSLPMRVQCYECGANIQAGEDDAKEDVIIKWNRRTILDEVYELCDDQIYTPEEQVDGLLRLIEKYNL